MAKSPGPAIAMAAAAALFLLSRGGSDDSDDTPEKEWEPPAPEDDGTTTTETGTEKPKTGGTGGGTSSNPPNLSGDSAGYNTIMFPNARAVREVLSWLGYSITVNDKSVVQNSAAKEFQRDYNIAAENGIFSAQGKVLADGTMGKYSLRALSIVATDGTESPGVTVLDINVPDGWQLTMMGKGTGGWGTKTGPCTVNVETDHGQMAHGSISASSATALSAALALGKDGPSSITLTLQNGLRGDELPEGPDYLEQHDHSVTLLAEDLRDLSEGGTVVKSTAGPSDGDDDHTHKVRFTGC